MRISTFLGIVSVSLISSWSFGQFHTRPQTGPTTSVSPGPNSTGSTGAPRTPSYNDDIHEAGAYFARGDMILPEGQRAALAQYNPRLGKKQERQVEVWARRIEHSDGTYTETVESNDKEQSNAIQQVTKSANGTTLQKRLVRLDRYQRPAEVLIRDGRGTFKYRGVMIYDAIGRFSEEQLFDANGTLIRRKVQEYTSDGFPKPVRSWDYVANVPEDLKLVITRSSENATDVDRSVAKPKERKGLFAKKQNTGDPASGQTQAAQVQATPVQGASAAEPEKRKGLSLGRLFGGSKRDK